MVYRDQIMLVIESQIKDGYRILLNREDLQTLQYMQWSIYETIVRKSILIQPTVLQQVDQILTYLEKMYDMDNIAAKPEKLMTFVKNITDDKIIYSTQKNE